MHKRNDHAGKDWCISTARFARTGRNAAAPALSKPQPSRCLPWLLVVRRCENKSTEAVIAFLVCTVYKRSCWQRMAHYDGAVREKEGTVWIALFEQTLTKRVWVLISCLYFLGELYLLCQCCVWNRVMVRASVRHVHGTNGHQGTKNTKGKCKKGMNLS